MYIYIYIYITETAVVNVLDDIIIMKDLGNLVQILLLDLSAAFDTLDLRILKIRLINR